MCVLCRLSGLVQVWCMSGAGVICTMCYFERWYGTDAGLLWRVGAKVR